MPSVRIIPILVQVVCSFKDLLDLLLILDSQRNLLPLPVLRSHSLTCLVTVFSTYFILTLLWCNSISRTTPKTDLKTGAEQDIWWKRSFAEMFPTHSPAEHQLGHPTLSVTRPVISRHFPRGWAEAGQEFVRLNWKYRTHGLYRHPLSEPKHYKQLLSTYKTHPNTN